MQKESESMMRVVLIDDEMPALQVLEFLLADFDSIEVVGKYSDPLRALSELPELQPDAVFLDINMPQMKGIDVASRILDIWPGADIVFVTAYEEYALEAFAVHALDYVLKPVDPDRLAKAIAWLRQRQEQRVQMLDQQIHGKGQQVPAQSNPRLEIRTLGQFRVGFRDQLPVHWRSAKTKELFAYLVYKQSREVRKEELIEVLWPEVDPEKASVWLYNGIYYIRKALEAAGIVRDQVRVEAGQTGNYKLLIGDAELDSSVLQELGDKHRFRDLSHLLSIYRGDFMEGEDYPWALLEREKLSAQFLDSLLRLAVRQKEAMQWNEAEKTLLEAYRHSPLEENATELLLEIYAETGNQVKLLRHYNDYARALEEELGIQPGERVRRFRE